jgi:hypothetical protein
MTCLDHLTDDQFEWHALDLLKRELGAAGLAQFLRLYRSRGGDYTTDRMHWQKDVTVGQIVSAIRKERASEP